ncbi:methyl-accepting chemotaxis protein [Neobacillus citreus]|uniref:Methyl-accepting chemotaxis protein n=1 Tax=Neobacillus citreus TaxID=2833578 RepID=A0A942TA93_9BACI|nr:methyl-accepting chemotaxis protein [Neobacillus citreus]MCH6266986.1 methyl-accepting chemotaxis protein [Neobacillus citreus]
MIWTINRKLLSGFLVVILILIMTIGVSYYQISKVNENYSFLLQDKAKKAVDIEALKVAAKQEIVSMRGYLIVGDDQALQDYNKAHDEYQNQYNNLLKRFQIKEAIDMLKELDRIENEYKQFTEHVFELKRQNKTEEYQALVSSQGREIVKRFDQQADRLSDYQNHILETGNKENTAKVNTTKAQILILGIIGVLIGVVTALFIGRLITRPLVTIANTANRISKGDLTVDEIKVKNKDELGGLAKVFNQMAINLRQLIDQVNLNSIQVASSAEELAASAEQTTQAANQIATSIQEFASGAESAGKSATESSVAVKEMMIGIREVAKSTTSVSELALETSKEANNGSDSLQKVTHQMDKINKVVDDSTSAVKHLGEHSKEIGKIVGVITSIAEQTNLLALNAAIESARAGEHGRGFAVVADEVRKLAEQSKNSAEQIAELIQIIQKDTVVAIDAMDKGAQEVKVGTEVVHEAEEGFKKIQTLIEQVTAQIQETSAASEEMSASVEQVNSSIQRIANSARNSADTTHSVASASEEQLAAMEQITTSVTELARMADDLQRHVSQFKVK